MKSNDSLISNEDQYLWVIGGGILQVPLIEEARKLNLKIIVTDGDKDCLCKDLSDIFLDIDIFDIDSHIKYCDNLICEGIKIKGVLAAGIDAQETMSKIAEYLNLPSVSSDVAHMVNNKELFREEMTKLNLPVPTYRVVTEQDLDDLKDLVDQVGYPLIVKNTSSSGSRGTKIFNTPNFNEVKEVVLEAIKVSRSSKALIESLWVGSEHTVETLFDINGKFYECFITDRIFDKSEGFAMETGLVHPSTLTKENQKQMYELAKNVADSIGIKIGAAKFDLILTKDGPRIIEMTVRLSGGFDCQFLVPAATGKNILRAAILTSCGEEFDNRLLVNSKNRVCLSESLWPNPGEITNISGLKEAKSSEGFEFIFFRYDKGDTVEPYTDCTKRVCFLLVSGSNLEEASYNMELIKNQITIDTKPQ